MEFSNRMPKVRKFGTPKNNNKYAKSLDQNRNITYKGYDHLSHPELRELQRYGTLSTNKRAIVDAICNKNAVIIKQDKDAVTAVVRHSSRYYIAVMDTKINVIKTFLPDNIENFLDYVQLLMDKEKSAVAA